MNAIKPVKMSSGTELINMWTHTIKAEKITKDEQEKFEESNLCFFQPSLGMKDDVHANNKPPFSPIDWWLDEQLEKELFWLFQLLADFYGLYFISRLEKRTKLINYFIAILDSLDFAPKTSPMATAEAKLAKNKYKIDVKH
uniref:Uncharacterized protein n=1 Tax=Romanomermis culicivorax TaxID=13658 RepID=A0A915K5U0_ROMCU